MNLRHYTEAVAEVDKEKEEEEAMASFSDLGVRETKRDTLSSGRFLSIFAAQPGCELRFTHMQLLYARFRG